MVFPASASGNAPPKLIARLTSGEPRTLGRKVSRPPWKITRSSVELCPWIRPTAAVSGVVTESKFNIQFVSLAGGRTIAATGGAAVSALGPLVCPATFTVAGLR